MKIHDVEGFPNPARVRLALAKRVQRKRSNSYSSTRWALKIVPRRSEPWKRDAVAHV